MGATDVVDFLLFTSNISFYVKYRKWIREGSCRKCRQDEKKEMGGSVIMTPLVQVREDSDPD